LKSKPAPLSCSSSYPTPLTRHLHRSFKWLDEEVDLDEIECIVANLIYQNKVKGYITHQKRTLILSKSDPFPKNAIIKSAS
jgi:nuclear mRNA export protein PCID2/THP1